MKEKKTNEAYVLGLRKKLRPTIKRTNHIRARYMSRPGIAQQPAQPLRACSCLFSWGVVGRIIGVGG